MSEVRRPTIIYTRKRFDDSSGKKQLKIDQKVELYPATFWSHKWHPGSQMFAPRPPLKTRDRRDFWLTRFRVKMNGKWVGPDDVINLFTEKAARDLLEE